MLATYLWLDAAVYVIAAQVMDQQLHDLITVGQQIGFYIASHIP